MIYVYSPKNYLGLDKLIAALGAERLFRFDGEDFWDKARKRQLRLEPESFIIPWGTTLPELDGFRVLNSKEAPLTRFEQLDLLTFGKVRHIDIYKETIHSSETKEKFINRQYGRKLVANQDPFYGDYYTGKHDFSKEFIVHSFLSKALRSAEKKPKDASAHPWIRNEAHGWVADYTVPSTPELRSIAHKAIKALGLSFGAVNVGLSTSGALMVISVDLATDLPTPNVVKVYTNSILKWIHTYDVVEVPVDALL